MWHLQTVFPCFVYYFVDYGMKRDYCRTFCSILMNDLTHERSIFRVFIDGIAI